MLAWCFSNAIYWDLGLDVKSHYGNDDYTRSDCEPQQCYAQYEVIDDKFDLSLERYTDWIRLLGIQGHEPCIDIIGSAHRLCGVHGRRQSMDQRSSQWQWVLRRSWLTLFVSFLAISVGGSVSVQSSERFWKNSVYVSINLSCMNNTHNVNLPVNQLSFLLGLMMRMRAAVCV